MAGDQVDVKNAQVELVADERMKLGEGPLWHPIEKKVYWTNILAGELWRYDPATSKHEKFYQGRPVGGFTLQEDGSLLLFLDKGGIATWRDGKLTTHIDSLPGEENARFNDVQTDPAGRVFCGILRDQGGVSPLYRLDTDGTIRAVEQGIGCCNGIGWSVDQKTMYFTDSAERTIYLYGYTRATGEISNRSVLIKTTLQEGVPDGLAMDAAGNIWSARWGGSGVFCHPPCAPDGKVIGQIDLPVKNVTSCCFGGDDLSDLYITTAGGDDPKSNGEKSGALFRARNVTKGMPKWNSRVDAGTISTTALV
ncbi:MAG TPA: SMP-30/gluconolactonase/LRE family protein [Tepidisphaeraceae bacterium]|jgi:D-xylonolactonase